MSIQSFLEYLKLIGVGTLLSPLVMGLKLPILGCLFFLLFLDFITGIYKAKVLQKVTSAKFGRVFERAGLYTAIFLAVKALTYISPIPFLEAAVLGGLALKELISIMENIKVVQIARGYDNTVVDKIINFLGINLDKLLSEASDKKDV